MVGNIPHHLSFVCHPCGAIYSIYRRSIIFIT
nr:MAG TPA: adenylate kinase [Caudoviricetes sp.]